MLQVRIVWLGAAAPVLALILALPALWQEHLRDSPPGQPKGDRRGLSKSPDYYNQLSFLGDVISRLKADYLRLEGPPCHGARIAPAPFPSDGRHRAWPPEADRAIWH